ncbi:MAG: hypothetical protein H8E21_07505 [Gammaproteobacteria bacterium]|nr:hypothetical protein [Gammaproteobacteria bacterium]MBL6999822.1 hypothetical protein [Gammaproteobacteria bacterium]
MADQIIKPVSPVTKAGNTLQKKKAQVKKKPPEGPITAPDKPQKKGKIDTFA